MLLVLAIYNYEGHQRVKISCGRGFKRQMERKSFSIPKNTLK